VTQHLCDLSLLTSKIPKRGSSIFSMKIDQCMYENA
jgi:hypothetical protein